MKNEIKRVFKIFFAWQEEKEAGWLHEMSKKGWHLKEVGIFKYVFQKGGSFDYTYRFDFKVLKKDDMEYYISIFEDAGWTYIGSVGSWHYFKTKGEGDIEPELYNDNRSKMEKYKRLLLFLGIIFLPVMGWALPNLYMRMIDMAPESILNNAIAFNIYLPFVILLTIVEIVAIYGIIRIILIINRLKKEIRE
jgi:hypothetical protein